MRFMEDRLLFSAEINFHAGYELFCKSGQPLRLLTGNFRRSNGAIRPEVEGPAERVGEALFKDAGLNEFLVEEGR